MTERWGETVVDDRERVTGRARFTSDLVVEGMLHGGTVRSEVPRGRLSGVDFDPDFDWSDIVIVDHRDIPGRNVTVLEMEDQPVLAERQVRHRGEAVALLAAPTAERLRAALDHVTVRVDRRPALEGVHGSVAVRVKMHGEDNVFHESTLRCGNTARALETAELVVEELFQLPPQEHLYLETHAALATVDDETVSVRMRTDWPRAACATLAAVLDVDPERVEVRVDVKAGSYAGKAESATLLAAHAALLAKKAGRPVRMVYSRPEDMAWTPKRHHGEVTCRSGVDANGRLVALEIDAVLDGGAYCTVSPSVVRATVNHALGPYLCDNVYVRGRAVATSTPPTGAFRGFTVPLAAIALEQHLDTVANRLGIAPVELRRRNLPPDSVARRLLDRAWVMRTPQRDERTGLGVALSWEPDERMEVRLCISLAPDRTGGVLARVETRPPVGRSEGQAVADEVARFLGISPSAVDVDTVVPEAGGAALVDLVGETALRIHDALPPGDDLARRIMLTGSDSERIIAGATGRFPPGSERPMPLRLGCHLVEAEVDPVTLVVSVERIVAVHERAPGEDAEMLERRLEAQTVTEMGYGRTEDVMIAEGSMSNHRLSRYVVPGAADQPRVEIVLDENPDAESGGGATAVSGCTSALVSAVRDATDLSFNELPVTSERIAQAMLTKTDPKTAPAS